MKVADWPARDRKLWLQAKTPVGPFDIAGLASTWRPATIRSVEQGYGLFLTWLQLNGSLDLGKEPIDRVAPETIEKYVFEYAPGRAPLTVAAALRNIAYMVRATSPPDGLPWLTKRAHWMANSAKAIKPKLPRLATIAELQELGRHLMAKGQAEAAQGKRIGLFRYRDGLMIVLLANRPLRRRNLSELRLGSSLIEETTGYRISFKGSQTKTSKPIDMHLPQHLDDPMEYYLQQVRPALLRNEPDHGWLWVGRWGKPLPPDSITVNIVRLTQQHLHRPIPPHLFRDCVATDIAVLDPKHVGITKEVLGHTSLATSQKFYNQATAIMASRRLGAALDDLFDTDNEDEKDN
jgi:integrase/recombinase XerC